MRILCLLMTMTALTFTRSVLANPVMVVNDAYAEQFPGTAHVQITRNYSSGATATTAVSRDGTALSITFESSSAGSRDLGSGAAPITAVVGCDCSVPIGNHSYVVAGISLELEVVAASAVTGTARSPSAECDTKCASTLVDGGSSTATGGTNAGTTILEATDAGTTTTAATDAAPSNGDSSGCSMARSAGSPWALPALVVLGLLLVRRRK